jgi:hypothetical protein
MRRGSVMTDPDEDERELEYSPLCADETREGITVRVEIYRFAGSGEGWSLEVVDQDHGSTVWKETFARDEDAYAEFYRTLEAEGIRSFVELPSGEVN